MDIKLIKTEADYESALKEIDQLFDARPGTPEGDKLEVLVTLVEAYEARHHKIPLPDPIDAIEHHMESRGLTRQDLEPYIGSRSRVYEILNRKRPLTLRMIRNLEAALGIPAAILVQKYDLNLEDDQDTEVETVAYEEWISTRLEHIEKLLAAIRNLEAGVTTEGQISVERALQAESQFTFAQNADDTCSEVESIPMPDWPVRRSDGCSDATTNSRAAYSISERTVQ